MTEAGSNWVGEKMANSGWKVASGHIEAEAEFWLRAFAAEVEKRAKTKNVERTDTKLQIAFTEVKRELLGPTQSTPERQSK